MKVTIETKFNVGDIVWVMYMNRPCKVEISRIYIEQCSISERDCDCDENIKLDNFYYKIHGHRDKFRDCDVYETKADLIQSLYTKGDNP